MKKLGIVCIILLAFLCGLGGVYSYAADTPQNPQITAINNNTEVSYLRLDNVNALYAGGDGLYIADKNGIYLGAEQISGTAAKKLDFYGDKLLTLKESGLYQGETLLKSGAFDSFAVSGESVYFLKQREIFEYEFAGGIVGAELNKWTANGNVLDLCAANNSVVYSTDSAFYLIDPEFDSVNLGVNASNKQGFYAAGDILAVLTSAEILLYSGVNEANPVLDKRIPYAKNGKKICFDGDNIYIAAADGELYFIDKINYKAASPSVKNYIASKGNADYFYNSPASVFTRNEKIYVADSVNNRVAVLSGAENEGGIDYLNGYANPSSVVALLNGDVIVAHQKNRLTNDASGISLDIRVSENVSLVPKIEKICIDFNNDIYVLTSLGAANYLFRTDPLFSTPIRLPYVNPLALGYKSGGGIAVYDDGAVRFINPDFDPDAADSVRDKKVVVCEPLTDFCIDYSDNIFGLNAAGNIAVIKKDESNVYAQSGVYTKITISTVANAFTGYNDLLLVSNVTHSLYHTSGAFLGVDDISIHFNVSQSLLFGATEHKAATGSIAKTNCPSFLFARPIESEINYSLATGDTIFIRHDMDAPDDMYLAVAEDFGSKTLKWGYIYKSSVDEPLTYSAPPSAFGKIHAASAVVYKYPSSYGATIPQLKLSVGDTVRLLPFAEEYTDVEGKDWLRIAIGVDGENEGYIKPQFVSTSLFSGANTLNANATVKNTTLLYIYDSMSKTYIEFDTVNELKKGTRVQVETPFDSSKKYTKVLFYVDGQILDIECYARTSDLAFDGLDVIQIVAVAVIAFTVILAIILTVAAVKRRKKRKHNLSAYYDGNE